MNMNMGTIDRGIRLVVGLALLIAAFFTTIGGDGWLYWLMILVGAIFTITAVIGTCPMYSIFGIKTCNR